MNYIYKCLLFKCIYEVHIKMWNFPIKKLIKQLKTLDIFRLTCVMHVRVALHYYIKFVIVMVPYSGCCIHLIVLTSQYPNIVLSLGFFFVIWESGDRDQSTNPTRSAAAMYAFLPHEQRYGFCFQMHSPIVKCWRMLNSWVLLLLFFH